MSKDLALLDCHMELFDTLLGPEQAENRETLFEYLYGRDTRPESYRPGREFFRVEITTRNFYHNPLRLQWFYHSDEKRESWRITSISFRGMALPYLNIEILGTLHQLEYIDCQGNQLTEFNTNALNFSKNLHTLNISSNKLRTFDFEPLSNNSKLRSINLYNNKLREIDFSHLSQCDELNRINLEGNNLTHVIMRGLKEIQYLITLDLSDNLLNQDDLIVPNQFLQHLILNDNRLETLDFSQLPQDPDARLSLINISNNHLRFIPLNQICSLPNIVKLYAWGNKIEVFHIDGYFRTITEIDLSSNIIRSAKIVGDFPSLKVLCLPYNVIRQFDFSVNAPNLIELNISFNPLGTLDLNINQFPSLESLDISGCPIKKMELPQNWTFIGSEELNIGNNTLVISEFRNEEHRLKISHSDHTSIS